MLFRKTTPKNWIEEWDPTYSQELIAWEMPNYITNVNSKINTRY